MGTPFDLSFSWFESNFIREQESKHEPDVLPFFMKMRGRNQSSSPMYLFCYWQSPDLHANKRSKLELDVRGLWFIREQVSKSSPNVLAFLCCDVLGVSGTSFICTCWPLRQGQEQDSDVVVKKRSRRYVR